MVKIRLMRMGKRKQPTYRVVVADARSPRDGRFIENIGKYEPRLHPSRIEIDEERALHWLRSGAQPSDPVRVLLERTGIWATFTGQAPPPPFDFSEPERKPKPAEEPAAEAAPEALEGETEASAEPPAEVEPAPEPESPGAGPGTSAQETETDHEPDTARGVRPAEGDDGSDQGEEAGESS
ncbi:MAG TPA: 30S ribosomal protein S16 [Actinomycetota bacterium]|nr:30S ribosomal protein S16 [Actinomycetota bacterium]